MGNDDFIQVVLIVSGDTEEVQFVALLIISDLETTSGSGAQLRAATASSIQPSNTLSQTAMHGPW